MPKTSACRVILSKPRLKPVENFALAQKLMNGKKWETNGKKVKNGDSFEDWSGSLF